MVLAIAAGGAGRFGVDWVDGNATCTRGRSRAWPWRRGHGAPGRCAGSPPPGRALEHSVGYGDDHARARKGWCRAGGFGLDGVDMGSSGKVCFDHLEYSLSRAVIEEPQ